MSKKMEIALQFPTGADLKNLKEVEGDFGGESLFHGFMSIFLCCLTYILRTLDFSALFSLFSSST